MSEQQYIERYWRDATPQDAIKEPPMLARFRNGEEFVWHNDYLMGIRRDSNYPWYSTNLGSHKQCQVYDAPDPGEGWRLIDPNTETLREGDGLMVSFDRESGWLQVQVRPSSWSEMDFYRRRIEQPKPEPRYEPFRWEDREQLRGRWIAYDDGNFEVYPTSFFLAESTFFVGTLDAQKLVDHWRFIDTGEPVGRKVE